MITKYYWIPFFFFFDLLGERRTWIQVLQLNNHPRGPEWPSPHDCTSSVSDELVLIQLLNLNPAQLQSLSHTFFFTHKPILLTQLPCSKQYSHQPHSSTYVKGFFLLKTLFLFVVIVTLVANWKNMAITRCWHQSSKKNKELLQLEDLSNTSCNIFKKTQK